jgi:hypothetical protein
MRKRWIALLGAGILAIAAPALADDADTNSGSSLEQGMAMFDEGKLLATGGVSTVEGAGGGGLSTWALISGYGSPDGVGLNAHFTYVNLPDYSLWSPGVAVGLFDRVELSYAYQTFDTQHVGALLGLGAGYEFHQSVYGAKVKVIGDGIYDQDSLLPQISVGAQIKNNDRGAVIHVVGGKSASGTDYYVSATKLFLAQSLLVSATLRETKANQFGILGFGGDKHNDYSSQFEGSLAYLISRKFAVGAEFRTKPSNLGVAHEGDAYDIFAAYFLNKNLSLTVAYANLGNVVIKNNQQGVYLSLQAGI